MDKWMLKAWEWLWPEMRKILSALLLVAIVSFAVFLLVHYSGVTRASVAFLLPVVIAAIRWGPVAAMAATIIGVAPMVFLLYDPIYDLKVSDPQQVLDLGLYVFVAVVVSRLAAQLSEARVRAEANVLRQAVVDSVSHELRTPLASILGSATVLDSAEPVANDRRLAGLVHGIREEAERLDREIQMLLDASRVSVDRIEPKKDLAEPADIINSAIVRRRRHISRHGLELEIAEDMPFVFVDSAMIEQALVQIVDNAGKYSPSSSHIRVDARASNNHVTITVTDQGAGFTAEEIRGARERFFRGHRHTLVTGSGLGLWIANAFIAANNGVLTIESAGPGRGSTVIMTLPSAKETTDRLESANARNDD